VRWSYQAPTPAELPGVELLRDGLAAAARGAGAAWFGDRQRPGAPPRCAGGCGDRRRLRPTKTRGSRVSHPISA